MKEFEFDSLISEIEWYYDTAEQLIKEKYPSPFHYKMILKTLKAFKIGVIYIIERNKNAEEDTDTSK